MQGKNLSICSLDISACSATLVIWERENQITFIIFFLCLIRFQLNLLLLLPEWSFYDQSLSLDVEEGVGRHTEQREENSPEEHCEPAELEMLGLLQSATLSWLQIHRDIFFCESRTSSNPLWIEE